MNDDLHKFAGELANATVRGRLTPTQAYAALAVRDIANIEPAWASYVDHARWLNQRREEVGWQIYHTIEPLVLRGRKSNAILAEAHGVNGPNGYYAEDEISPLAAGFVLDIIDAEKRRTRRRDRVG